MKIPNAEQIEAALDRLAVPPTPHAASVRRHVSDELAAGADDAALERAGLTRTFEDGYYLALAVHEGIVYPRRTDYSTVIYKGGAPKIAGGCQ